MQYRPPRKRCNAHVGLVRDGVRYSGHLLDFSEDGLKLRAAMDAQPGQMVRLHAKGAVVSAEIRWRDQDRIGLRFADDGAQAERRRFLTRLHAAAGDGRRGRRVHGFSEL